MANPRSRSNVFNALPFSTLQQRLCLQMQNIKWIYYTYLFFVSQVHSALSGNTLGIPWLHITSVYLTEKKIN